MYESGLLVWYSLKKLGIAIHYTVYCTVYWDSYPSIQYTGIATHYTVYWDSYTVQYTVYWDSYTVYSILG